MPYSKIPMKDTLSGGLLNALSVVVSAQNLGADETGDSGQHTQPCAHGANRLREMSVGIGFEIILIIVLNVEVAVETNVHADAVNKRGGPEQYAHDHYDKSDHTEILFVEVESDYADSRQHIGKRKQNARACHYEHKREDDFIESRNIARTAQYAIPADTGGEILRYSFQRVGV